ncbi:MAG: glycosyltransferase family 2 protein [Syntrophobacterales bacterium]|jgi:glycosyltransferase involved in cell wall biosynthesis|nr:glycosyltransferase family 2 protein [Syntrophobacterales bacterium]
MPQQISKLSIIVPVYNEEKTIFAVLGKINKASLPNGIAREVIVINDESSDNTEEEIKRYQRENPAAEIRYLKHETNLGKGAALRTGIMEASGDCLIIQDADLEYDPDEYALLLKPFLDGHADVVYGSRFMGGGAHRVLFFSHSIGNRFLTFCSNLLTNLNLTDMETCYKLFRTDIIKGIRLRENRFGFEPEVTAKVARVPGVRIYEVGISYYGRTYREGKKINWKDGVRALYCIMKYGLLKGN